MKPDIAQSVTDKILSDMAKHGSNWTVPWVSHGASRNFVTGKPYRGVNVVITAFAGFKSPFFGSFKQWTDAGAQITKGSTATHVVFYKPISIKDKETDEDKTIRLMRVFPVFNQEQTDGKGPSLRIEPKTPIGRHEECDRVIRESGISIRYGGDQAFYSPAHDIVTVPKAEQFKNPEAMYGVTFHELTHATGHKNRLERNLTGKFGDPKYSFEELIAETGSALLCVATGISKEPREDHARYLNSWMQGLQSDKTAILRAFGKAQAAADWILKTEPEPTRPGVTAKPEGLEP